MWKLFNFAGLLSLIGLATWTISSLMGCRITHALGLMLWILSALPLTSLFMALWMANFADAIGLSFKLLKTRSKPIPQSILEFARHLNATPPKTFKIVESDQLNAGVFGRNLYVTSTLYNLRHTELWAAVIGHELGHLMNFRTRKTTIRSIAALTISSAAGFTLISYSFAQSLTSLTVFFIGIYMLALLMPRLTHGREFDADQVGVSVAGMRAMSNLFGLMANDPRVKSTSESNLTHPSISDRVRNIGGKWYR